MIARSSCRERPAVSVRDSVSQRHVLPIMPWGTQNAVRMRCAWAWRGAGQARTGCTPALPGHALLLCACACSWRDASCNLCPEKKGRPVHWFQRSAVRRGSDANAQGKRWAQHYHHLQ